MLEAQLAEKRKEHDSLKVRSETTLSQNWFL